MANIRQDFMAQRFLFILLFMTFIQVKAQEDFSWWNEKHQWDGKTAWNQYMKYSTSYFGPNALPVPDVMTGEIDTTASLEVAGEYHWSTGDKTKNIFVRGNLPLFSNRIAFSMDVVPIEWYETDTITRDARAARGRDGKGKAGGDIYFHTLINLIYNRENVPDIALRVTLRMASGTNLRNARYTDSPGYFFDLSFGKNVSLSKDVILRAYTMSGFYVYQTNDLSHLQNDCILFGLGADVHIRKIVISQSIGGYNGYLKLGDRPLVYRACVKLSFDRLAYSVLYQYGLRDYPFQKLRGSLIFKFN